MERSIELAKIIALCKLEEKELAEILFPQNKYPAAALQRIIQRESLLDSEQVLRLSKFTGLSLEELYGESWTAITKGKKVYFTKGDFKAELDTETWVTKLYNKEALFFDKVISSGVVSLKEYFNKIDNIIVNL